MGLIDLIRGAQKTATGARVAATYATEDEELTGSVAKIAVAPSTDTENTGTCASPRLDPDHHCWPHSVAMNAAEIDLFSRRWEVFLAKGLDEAAAEGLAYNLVMRDRDGDDRRVCLECRHLKGFSVLRCDNWKVAGIATSSDSAFVHQDFGMLLQRCDGFSS